MEELILKVAQALFGTNPIVTIGVSVVGFFFGVKILDKILLKYLIPKFKPEWVINLFLKFIEKGLDRLNDLIILLDDKYLDKYKKKAPKSIKIVEDRLIESIVLLKERSDQVFEDAKKAIRD